MYHDLRSQNVPVFLRSYSTWTILYIMVEFRRRSKRFPMKNEPQMANELQIFNIIGMRIIVLRTNIFFYLCFSKLYFDSPYNSIFNVHRYNISTVSFATIYYICNSSIYFYYEYSIIILFSFQVSAQNLSSRSSSKIQQGNFVIIIGFWSISARFNYIL